MQGLYVYIGSGKSYWFVVDIFLILRRFLARGLRTSYPFTYVGFLIMKQELTDHFNAPVVFAHNDLLSGNIMVNDEEGILGKTFL